MKKYSYPKWRWNKKRKRNEVETDPLKIRQNTNWQGSITLKNQLKSTNLKLNPNRLP